MSIPVKRMQLDRNVMCQSRVVSYSPNTVCTLSVTIKSTQGLIWWLGTVKIVIFMLWAKPVVYFFTQPSAQLSFLSLWPSRNHFYSHIHSTLNVTLNKHWLQFPIPYACKKNFLVYLSSSCLFSTLYVPIPFLHI